MQVTLSDHASEVIRRQIAEGLYESVEDAVEAAILALEGPPDEESVERIRELIAEADEDIERGYIEEVTPEYIERLKDYVRAKYDRAG